MAMASSVLRMDAYFVRLVKGPAFPKNEEMKYEGVRLTTFKTWPGWGAVWPTVLAKAGFFYTKTADQVACFCCGGRLKTWEAGDSPMTEHKRFFPRCRFVTGRDSTNVPLGDAPEIPSEDQRGRNLTMTDHQTQLTNNASSAHGQSLGSSSLMQLSPAVGKHEYASLQLIPAGGAAGGASLTIQQRQEMKFESKRLETFKNWPVFAYARSEHLAKTGLYYLSIADHVRCAFCCVVLSGWEPNHDPAEVHVARSEKCAFLKDAWAAGNVSIEEEKANNRQASQNAVANPSPSLGIVRAEEPKSLNYSGETSRLSSFRQWPRNANQTPDALARAGFYYTGIEDSVKCFSCSGTLRNWEREDDSWTEHARWFPRCNYVRTVKGDAFIRSVQATHSGQTNAVTAPNSTDRSTQSANAGARTFPVEPRMVRARMDTTRVRSVLDMGFTRDLLYDVIKHRLTTTGDDFPNVTSLLEAVFAAEEALSGSSSSPTRRMSSTMSRAAQPPAASTASGNGESPATPGNGTATAAAVCNGATASTGENQAPASPKGKTQKRKKKSKSATGSNGNNGSKTTLSASELSLSADAKSEVQTLTAADERLRCKICMDDEAQILFLPCGHLCSCAKCAPALSKCAICRALIRGTVKVYLA